MPQIKLCQMVFRTYVERQLIPYFAACGVHVEGSSGDALQRARLDDPRDPPSSCLACPAGPNHIKQQLGCIQA